MNLKDKILPALTKNVLQELYKMYTGKKLYKILGV